MWACYGLTQFLASLFLRCAVPVTTGSFWMIATSDELLAIHIGLVSDSRRGRYMVLPRSFFFPPRFCPGHISGTVTRRDSRLSVLLGPAV